MARQSTSGLTGILCRASKLVALLRNGAESECGTGPLSDATADGQTMW